MNMWQNSNSPFVTSHDTITGSWHRVILPWCHVTLSQSDISSDNRDFNITDWWFYCWTDHWAAKQQSISSKLYLTPKFAQFWLSKKQFKFFLERFRFLIYVTWKSFVIDPKFYIHWRARHSDTDIILAPWDVGGGSNKIFVLCRCESGFA